jgi:hypothetical protein
VWAAILANIGANDRRVEWPLLPDELCRVTGGSRTVSRLGSGAVVVRSLIEIPSVSEPTPKLLGYLARPGGDDNLCLVDALRAGSA